MMNVFLDTSALSKFYHREPGTDELDTLLKNQSAVQLYISEVTIVEFYSATTKKLRVSEINFERAYELISLLETDIKNYKIVKIDSSLLHRAKELALQYSQEGLRTLDAVQIASAIEVSDDITLVKIFDDKQSAVMNLEGLKVM